MHNRIDVFPHVLVRIAGESFQLFQQLECTKTNHIVEELYAIDKTIATLGGQLSDVLFSIISGSEPTVQKKLLNIKRDVFNGRKLSDEKFLALQDLVPEEYHGLISAYQSAHMSKSELSARGEQSYHKELVEGRLILRELVLRESFQKGLLLSSQSLLSSIQNFYVHIDPNKLSKNDRQTEKGLIKYLSRMYAKTTPYSTFTNLAMAGIEPDVGKAYNDKVFFTNNTNTPRTIKSHIRLNNFLYQYLRALLTKSPEICRHIKIRPNPTIQKMSNFYLFLTNSNNVEAFQRIPSSPIVEFLLELIDEFSSGISIADFAHHIVEGEYIEAEQEQIEAYLKQLVEYGFFEYNVGVSGIDPDWDIKLRSQLSPLALQFPLIAELLQTLEQIRLYAGEYETADVGRRKAILSEAHTQFRNVCIKIHEAAGLPEDERKTPEERAAEARKKMKEAQEQAKIKAQEEQKPEENQEQQAKQEENEKTQQKDPEEQTTEEEQNKEEAFKHRSNTYFSYKPEQMFYEDTTFEALLVFRSEQIETLCTKLHTLLQSCWTFSGQFDEKETMLHFFTQKYGDTTEVDLMTFYEEYFREWKKPEAERQKKAQEEQRKKAQQAKEEAEKHKEQQAQEPNNSVPSEKLPEESAQEVQEKVQEPPVAEAPVIPGIKKRREQNAQWIEQYSQTLKAQFESQDIAEVITINFDTIVQVSEQLSYPSTRTVEHRSYGMFVQLFEEPDASGKPQYMGVINAPLSGFGKMVSRFLHIFDQNITKDVRDWNLKNTGETMVIEDCDASYFNANLHPPLMPFEIWMPGGHNTLPDEQQIPVTDLFVRASGSGTPLELVHKPTGKICYVFDLGFQGHGGRSQLFQLLEKFSRAEYLNFYPVVQSIASLQRQSQTSTQANAEEKQNDITNSTEPKPAKPSIRKRPRVVYENQLILQRQAWFIPKELLPHQQALETDWAYFLRLNTWRKELGMPDEIFLFVNPREQQQQQENIDTDAARRITRDDYKPQYISFCNPFMVKLFETSLSKVANVLKIEEMLPNSKQLATVGGQPFVTECVVQWYC